MSLREAIHSFWCIVYAARRYPSSEDAERVELLKRTIGYPKILQRLLELRL